MNISVTTDRVDVLRDFITVTILIKMCPFINGNTGHAETFMYGAK
jgi:hypothetical protein